MKPELRLRPREPRLFTWDSTLTEDGVAGRERGRRSVMVLGNGFAR